VDHFRPKVGAVGLGRDYSPDHYWWLAYEWTNLYLACKACDNLKGTKFPVDGKRAPLEGDKAALSREKRLLLDPCVDLPDDHIAFDEGGLVHGRTRQGAVTIEVLALNRTDLVEGRRSEALKVNEVLRLISLRIKGRCDRSLGGPDGGDLVAAMLTLVSGAFIGKHRRQGQRLRFLIETLLSPESAHLAAKRQIILRWWQQRLEHRAGVKQRSKLRGRGSPAIAGLEAAPRQPPAVKRGDIATVRIDEISIRNFKAIERLDLTCTSTGPGGTPWLMLLGVNASGKSSVLQAVALALAGKEHRRELRLDGSGFVRHGADRGHVELKLSGRVEPLRLEFGRGLRSFGGSANEVNTPVLGYGATRLLPSRQLPRPERADLVRIKGLFDPFVPLVDARRWLGHVGRDEFDYTALAIRDILAHDLPTPDEARLIPSAGGKLGFKVRIYGEDVSLDDLSDGYQSLIGLTVDLISGLRIQQKGRLETAEGIVLLDEMGAHLHPRWRMRVVGSLRRAFPRVQFVASTHDPLCLRGLADREVVVLRRGRQGRIFSVTDLPPLGGQRVDQLLTSEFFGLDSVMDPKIEALFREYYDLLALRSPTAEQRRRIRELGGTLAEVDVPGTTRRERMLLQVIDGYLANSERQPSLRVREAMRSSAEWRLGRCLSRR